MQIHRNNLDLVRFDAAVRRPQATSREQPPPAPAPGTGPGRIAPGPVAIQTPSLGRTVSSACCSGEDVVQRSM